MKYVNSTGASTTPPTPPAGGDVQKYYQNTEPTTTHLDPHALNAIQQEIANAVIGSGQSIDPSDDSQLDKALKSIKTIADGKINKTTWIDPVNITSRCPTTSSYTQIDVSDIVPLTATELTVTMDGTVTIYDRWFFSNNGVNNSSFAYLDYRGYAGSSAKATTITIPVSNGKIWYKRQTYPGDTSALRITSYK